MTSQRARHRKPAITISQSDHEKLMRLAQTAIERHQEAAEDLLAELERARVVPDERLKDGIARMGSTLRYATDGGEVRTVTLVYPGEADISAGRISILTPIGAALIGLSHGQSIDWEARDGRVRRLTIESVEPVSADAI
jgi:regulator of nucleoside diphosphate kinase